MTWCDPHDNPPPPSPSPARCGDVRQERRGVRPVQERWHADSDAAARRRRRSVSRREVRRAPAAGSAPEGRGLTGDSQATHRGLTGDSQAALVADVVTRCF